MVSKSFDIIVLGASGYIGRCVAKYLHFLEPKLKWAIAGRSHSKLAELKAELSHSKLTGLPDILIADVNDNRGLRDMFETCKLVLNCTGPYRLLANNVIEACLASGAHYMDLCGEPSVIEKSFLDNHERATANKLLVIHSCGFNSALADIGSLFTMHQFPPLMCLSIESYLIIRCPDGLSAHYTTFESSVLSAGDSSALKKIRKATNDKFHVPSSKYLGPKMKQRPAYSYDERFKKYTIPFNGADASVVQTTQRTISLLEGQLIWPQYQAYIAISSAVNAAATSFYGSICKTLAGSSAGRTFLLAFPELATGGVITHTGPNQKQLESTSFELHFIGKGYSMYLPELFTNLEVSISPGSPNRKEKQNADEEKVDFNEDARKEKDNETRRENSLVVSPTRADVQQTSVLSKSCASSFYEPILHNPTPVPPTDRHVHISISGPEPTYISTSIIMTTMAICLLEERSSLPSGGVFTPAAAFHKSTTLIDRLDQAGIGFTIKDTGSQNESEEYLDEVLVAANEEDSMGNVKVESRNMPDTTSIDSKAALDEKENEIFESITINSISRDYFGSNAEEVLENDQNYHDCVRENVNQAIGDIINIILISSE